MKIQNAQTYNTSFKGALTNKCVLASLKKISEHATSFCALTSFAMSTGIRTFSILKTPNVEKENKEYAAANSICSGLVKFGIVEAVALPVENLIKKIDNNPEKYLSLEAQKFYTPRMYKFITQILKQSTSILTAIPKSVLTVMFIPIVMDTIFSEKNKISPKTPVKTKHPSFKNNLAKLTGKFLSLNQVKNFSLKYYKHDKDINKHMTATTDILLTAASTVQINKSKKIKEKRKKPLIYTNIINTGSTLLLGYGIDKITKINSKNFIEKFSQIHKNDPNLPKYIEGINILRPTLIFALIYYGILPIFSTFIAEKTDKLLNNQN